MKDAPNFITHLLGFEKLNKYEIEYLHDANIRSSSYMGVIVVLLEIWMLIRQTYSKIIPKLQAGEEWVDHSFLPAGSMGGYEGTVRL